MAAAKTTSISPLAGSQHKEARCEPREQRHALVQFEEAERKISDASVEQSDVARISSLLSATMLKASPYAGPEHLLQLDTLEIQNRLMALALSSLSPARPDYATAAYQQAFDWDQVVALLATLAREQRITWKKQSFYVVEFRSKLKEDIDNDRLYMLDKQSHMEATASGGLLKYWYGIPDSERYNLATCLWRSKEDAVKGGLGPWHQQARAIIPQMYEMINIKGLSLTIYDGINSWAFLM